MRLFRAIFERNGIETVDRIFFMITRSADGHVYAGAAVWLWLIYDKTGKEFFTTALIAYGIKVPVYMIVKRLIKRKRPFDSMHGIRFLIPPPDQFSFPSGHTAGAFVFAVLMGHFFPALSIPWLVWSALVGISRIYVGVHYPSDVIAGAALGVLSAEFALSFL